MIDDLLRDTFARHETLAPQATAELRSAIDDGARRRRVRRRRFLSSAAALVVLAFATVLAVLPSSREHSTPADLLTDGGGASMHFLLLGTDRQAARAGEQVRADAILLVHVDPATRTTFQVSIPRDLLVDLPGFGPQRANSAYLFGGYSLTEQIVSTLLGAPIEGGAVVDYAAMQAITRAVGGVDLCVDQRTESIHLGYDRSGRVVPRTGNPGLDPVVYEVGCRHFAAWEALDYVRQRNSLPGGAEDRDRHLRQLLSALMAELSDPVTLSKALPVAAQALDLHLGRGQTLPALAIQLGHMSNGQLRGIRLPTRLDNGTVVLSGDAADLFTALRTATVPAWLAAHPEYAS
ncbi:hypothetical protein GCM10010399_15950 [Dactylosporangium fulvum]|uniref:LCP family protein n=1 Tax=Dactylosporangium fulvum TaxID=53359 RepID=A0ABY5VYF4_9ACTN|nr:LCP family protein [Dactylosporangium fulvum]UWP82675.1 LCP family protein [Dactylosporangium fulvum]